MKTHWFSLAVLVPLVLASCAPSGAETLPPDPQKPPFEEALPTSTENVLQSSNTPEATEMPSNPPPVEKFVSLAKKDLAERLKITMDGITLVKTAEMTWPNAALGCPSPGKMYAQGQVPGYQIQLKAGDVEYVYNTDLTGQVIFCPSQNPDDPASLIPAKPSPTSQIGVPIK